MISVVIPTLNEKKNISKIIIKLKKINIIKEVIFVDDNSSDGTFKEICRFKKKKFVRGYSRNAMVKMGIDVQGELINMNTSPWSPNILNPL